MLTGVLCGCKPVQYTNIFGPKPPLNTWVANDMANLTAKTPPTADRLIYTPQSHTVRLFGAANETLSFQLVIDTKDHALEGLELSCDDLQGRRKAIIPGSNVRAFHARPIRITSYPAWYLRLVDSVPQPVEYYDALVPMGGKIASPSAGKNQRVVLWVDLSIGRDCVGGTYKGKLHLSSSTHSDWAINLEVKVYDFVLPDARPLVTTGGFESNNIYRQFVSRNGKPYVPIRWNRRDPLILEGLTVMRQFMRMSHKHRLDLFDKSIRPIVKRDMFGKMQVNWEDYDAIVSPYLTGSAFDDQLGSPAWPICVSTEWPLPRYYGGSKSETYLAAIADLIEEYRKHFSTEPAQKGKFFFWPYRQEVNQQGFEQQAHLARICRGIDTQMPILSQLPLDAPPLSGWDVPKDMAQQTDIHAAGGQYFVPSPVRSGPTGSLAGTWLTPGNPPYLPSLGIIATGADARAIPWMAMKYGCSGLFLPEVLHWKDNPFESPASAETCLFYPGKSLGVDEILPSIRLKRLRRGLQDITYIWLLQQRNKKDTAQRILNAMVRYGGRQASGDHYLDARLDGWVQDPLTWQMARKLLAEELHAAVMGVEDSQQLLSQRVAWSQFSQQTQQIRVEQIRSQTKQAKNDSSLLESTIWLELFNEHDRQASVNVQFDTLPDGWQIIRGRESLSPMPAASRKVVKLVAQSPHIPSDNTGKMNLPISIISDMHRRQKYKAAIPFVMAGTIGRPITIDGDLKDWPLRTNNTAGAFTLIGRRGLKGMGLAERQTSVMLLRDNDKLYIAFRCNEPNMDAITSFSDNRVRYQQLMASQEDLVEILLDPGCQAKSAEDLYHIVIKPSGVLLAEKGISTEPPLGKTSLWSVPAQVAVQKLAKSWTVELAIPLSALPASANEAFWGVNFMRYASQGAEASSWSQAPRYFYAPKNLGTMYFPPATKGARQ